MATDEASASTSDRPSSRGRSNSRVRGWGRGRSTQPDPSEELQSGVGIARSTQSWQPERPPSNPMTEQQAQRPGRGRGRSFGRSTPPTAAASTELPQREQPGYINGSVRLDPVSDTQELRRRGRGWHPSQAQQAPRHSYARGRQWYPSYLQHAPGTVSEAPEGQWQDQPPNLQPDIETHSEQAVPVSRNFIQQQRARGRGRGRGHSLLNGSARQADVQTVSGNGHSSHTNASPASYSTFQDAGPSGRISNSGRILNSEELQGQYWESRPPPTASSQSRTRVSRYQRGGYVGRGRGSHPYQPVSFKGYVLPASTTAPSVAESSAADATSGMRSSGLRADAPEFKTALDFPSCVVCCGDLKVASVGKCNHKDVCATCSLRMRLCYDSNACPLCKADLKEVVMTPWRPSGVPDWEALQAEMSQLWTKPQWLRGVFVDNRAVPELLGRSRPLSSELEGSTGRACPVCDSQGSRLFPSNRSLQRHVSLEHCKTFCEVCLAAQRQFPLELEAFDQDKLPAHMASHPLCEFCNLPFFGPDELFLHMRTEHFTCHVCQQLGSFTYFAHADQFTRHLREEHFICEEEACDSCFAAFATVEELIQHQQEVHGRIRRMPRFDRSRARPIVLSTDSSALPRGPRAREPSATTTPVRPRSTPRSTTNADGRTARREGMRMIDDDFGLTGEAFPAATSRPEGLPGPQPLPRGSERGGGAAPREAFPSLAGQGEAVQTREPREQPRRPRLVSTTRHCACGRRTDHPVIPEGQPVDPLQCDAECERQKRRQQLADAFNIDAAHHTPVLERNRLATHPPELLLYAWHHRSWIANVERMLVLFLADDGKRHSLPAMPKSQREVVHKLASLYGITTQSYGQEPKRYVELFKGPESCPISNPLSCTAAAMTLEEVEAAMRAKQGHTMHLTDVAPGTDLHPFFVRWEGQATVSGPFANGTATVKFASEAALQDALTALGGGLRGLFLIDRKALRIPKGAPGSSGAHALSAHSQSRQSAEPQTSNGHMNGFHAASAHANSSSGISGCNGASMSSRHGQRGSEQRSANGRLGASTGGVVMHRSEWGADDPAHDASLEPQPQVLKTSYDSSVQHESMDHWEDVGTSSVSLSSP